MRRLSWRQQSLAVKLTLIMTIEVIITVVAVTLVSIQREQRSYRSELQSQASLLLNMLASASADRLYHLDHAFLSDLMNNLGNDRIVAAGRIYDGQGRVIADAYHFEKSFGSQPDPLGQQLLASSEPLFEWQPDQLLAGQAVIAGRERLGAISVGLSTAPLNNKMAAVRDQGIAVGIVAAVVGALLTLLVSQSITEPLRGLTAATKRLAEGDLTRVIAVRGGDELAALAASFNTMATSLAARITAVQQARAEAERLQQIEVESRHVLEQTLAGLRESIAAREQLSATVRALSSPIIPVLEGTLVMPLIGVIDTERAALLINSLLRAIEQHCASKVIIDVTGVPIIDTQVAQTILQAADAARLLGAQVILVGLRPELAQTIVGLGLNLSNLITRRFAERLELRDEALKDLPPTEPLSAISPPIRSSCTPALTRFSSASRRGRSTRAAAPLPGVTISVLGHPEYGQTQSRADGVFDLAVSRKLSPLPSGRNRADRLLRPHARRVDTRAERSRGQDHRRDQRHSRSRHHRRCCGGCPGRARHRRLRTRTAC